MGPRCTRFASAGSPTADSRGTDRRTFLALRGPPARLIGGPQRPGQTRGLAPAGSSGAKASRSRPAHVPGSSVPVVAAASASSPAALPSGRPERSRSWNALSGVAGPVRKDHASVAPNGVPSPATTPAPNVAR